MAVKLKLNDDGFAEVKDGKPVYVDDAGKETLYDAPAMHGKIGELNQEAQRHREKAEQLEQQYEKFKDIDPEKARDALKKLKDFDDSKLVDAGKLDEIRAATAKEFQEKLDARNKEFEQLQGQLNSTVLENAFATSDFVNKKLALPPDVAVSYFSKHFKIENGKLKPVDREGNTIYSSENPGKVADFNEALSKLVSSHPNKDSLLKADINSGSGGLDLDDDGDTRVITRKQFDSLSPGEQAKAASLAAEGKMKIK